MCLKSQKASKEWKHSPRLILNYVWFVDFYFGLKTVGWTRCFGFVKNEAYFTMTKCTTFNESRLLFQEWQWRKQKMQRDLYYDNLQISTLVIGVRYSFQIYSMFSPKALSKHFRSVQKTCVLSTTPCSTKITDIFPHRGMNDQWRQHYMMFPMTE